ncbi:hypothetical protein ACFL34_05745 [Candidatus Sumerlaeota bacterium]
MELTLPNGKVEPDPPEDKIVALVNVMDPNSPQSFTLARADNDSVEAAMTTNGLVLRCQDPTTGLTLNSKGPYLSKSLVIITLKAYLVGDARWNMHVEWGPAGAGGKKKKGCLGVMLLCGGALAGLGGAACAWLG